jgi:hypothetical protein
MNKELSVSILTRAEKLHKHAKMIKEIIDERDGSFENLRRMNPDYKQTFRDITDEVLEILESGIDNSDGKEIAELLRKSGVGNKTFLNQAQIFVKELKELKQSSNGDELERQVLLLGDFAKKNMNKIFEIPIDATTMELKSWKDLVEQNWGENIFKGLRLDEQVKLINKLCPFDSPFKVKGQGKDMTVSLKTQSSGLPDCVIIGQDGQLHSASASNAPISDVYFESDQVLRHPALLRKVREDFESELIDYADFIKSELDKGISSKEKLDNLENNKSRKKLKSEIAVDLNDKKSLRKVIKDKTGQRALIEENLNQNPPNTHFHNQNVENVFTKGQIKVLREQLKLENNEIPTLVNELVRTIFTTHLIMDRGVVNSRETFNKYLVDVPFKFSLSLDTIKGSGENELEKLIDFTFPNAEQIKKFKDAIEELVNKGDRNSPLYEYFDTNDNTRALLFSIILMSFETNDKPKELEKTLEFFRKLSGSNGSKPLIERIESKQIDEELKQQQEAIEWLISLLGTDPIRVNQMALEQSKRESQKDKALYIVNEYKKSLLPEPKNSKVAVKRKKGPRM